MAGMGIVGGVLGAVIGAVITWPAGGTGAMYGWALGSGLGGVVDYMTQPDRYGPKMQDKNVQVSGYGETLSRVWGSKRIAGNVIWPRNFEVDEHEKSESAKGGPDTKTYWYTATFAVAFCLGPEDGSGIEYGRVWMNKKLVRNPNGSPEWDPAVWSVDIYTGTHTQQPNPTMVAKDGSAPAYLRVAYMVFTNLDLSDSGFGGRPPSVEAEIFSKLHEWGK